MVNMTCCLLLFFDVFLIGMFVLPVMIGAVLFDPWARSLEKIQKEPETSETNI